LDSSSPTLSREGERRRARGGWGEGGRGGRGGLRARRGRGGGMAEPLPTFTIWPPRAAHCVGRARASRSLFSSFYRKLTPAPTAQRPLRPGGCLAAKTRHLPPKQTLLKTPQTRQSQPPGKPGLQPAQVLPRMYRLAVRERPRPSMSKHTQSGDRFSGVLARPVVGGEGNTGCSYTIRFPCSGRSLVAHKLGTLQRKISLA